MKKQGIGYEKLKKNEKLAYEILFDNLMKKAKTINGSGISSSVDLMKILGIVLGDNPQITYFDKTCVKVSYSLLAGKQFSLFVPYSISKINNRDLTLQQSVKHAIDEIDSCCPVSDYSRLLSIYEYLQDHVIYDDDEFNAVCKGRKSTNIDSHNAYGALINGKAVCDGIAAAFCILAQAMGYECTVVSGRATFLTTGFSEHAWNIIKVGEHFYHVDATWDINHKREMENYSYEYFCVDDSDIQNDHQWDINITPACNYNDLSYYCRSQCLANNLTQIEDIFIRFSKSKQKQVRVKISSSVSIPEPAEEYLSTKLLDVSSSFGRVGSIRYMWNDRMKCFYAAFQ